ncbi:Lcl C-terminal domain-containing protein [Desulfogranum mediterraneum]|uniref:Lcl C-terminal domain-containing protein n=1 Tax=Desulfogranum mediterraneum TaxID=160661 RepID=UPI0003FE038A|nr:DUF1566 domain-containing protein [Desulfogranum mediterraneum]
MGLFKKLQIPGTPTVDWEMTPEYTFGTFESWGGVERVRSKNERTYYFFIDAWGEVAKLCLMERGIKHARVVAEILAPQELVEECVREQGKVALFERTHPINARLKEWLIANVLESDDESKIIPLHEEMLAELGPAGLPLVGEQQAVAEPLSLSVSEAELSEEDVVALIKKYDFVDHERSPEGSHQASLLDSGDGQTVIDQATGLMWQREGLDIMSNRSMRRAVEQLNQAGFAGYRDWRIPTMAEGLSLMCREMNERGLYLHPCFSPAQPFIFVAATRKPGGYWFVDYKHGRAFWASGTIPGGFGRLCRGQK